MSRIAVSWKRRGESTPSRGTSIRHDAAVGWGPVGWGPAGWSQEEVGSAVQDEADKDDRGQAVNWNFFLQAMGKHWKLLCN